MSKRIRPNESELHSSNFGAVSWASFRYTQFNINDINQEAVLLYIAISSLAI